jgi:hypothetical protein
MRSMMVCALILTDGNGAVPCRHSSTRSGARPSCSAYQFSVVSMSVQSAQGSVSSVRPDLEVVGEHSPGSVGGAPHQRPKRWHGRHNPRPQSSSGGHRTAQRPDRAPCLLYVRHHDEQSAVVVPAGDPDSMPNRCRSFTDSEPVASETCRSIWMFIEG